MRRSAFPRHEGSHGEDCTRTGCPDRRICPGRLLGPWRGGGAHQFHDAKGHGISAWRGRLGACPGVRWPGKRVLPDDSSERSPGLPCLFGGHDGHSGVPRRRPDVDGTVYMVWELVHKSGQAQGPQDVAVTKSSDKGASWTISYVDTGLPPGPSCPTTCGWDYLGTGASISADRSGHLYVTYNAPITDNGPPFIWYKTSANGGMTWSSRTMLNVDGTGAFHVFPGIEAGDAGDVR